MTYRQQLKILGDKLIAGTITVSERDQLNDLLREQLRKTFDCCPVCRGAFSSDLGMNDDIRCPLCETQLFHWSSDITGHHDFEVDPSLPESNLLGEFCAGYSIPGVIVCNQCGTRDPKAYSCCPQLFRTALQHCRTGAANARTATTHFLELHSQTLLNVLRSGFATDFGCEEIQLLRQLAPGLKCFDEIGSLLEDLSNK